MTNYLNSSAHNKMDVWGVTLCFMLVVMSVLIPDAAMAIDTAGDSTGTGALTGTICKIVSALQGPVARGVAACGIIFLGFSLFMGKISWGTALSLGIGLGAIFGANKIVGLMNSIDGANACGAV